MEVERKNLEIQANMVMQATQKIKIGEELFCDYNRDVLCVGCNTLVQLFLIDRIKNTKL
jgi:hypothetical protein